MDSTLNGQRTIRVLNKANRLVSSLNEDIYSAELGCDLEVTKATII